MRIFDGKQYRDMTQEEIQELAANSIPEEIKETLEHRLEKLEKLFSKFAEMMGVK